MKFAKSTGCCSKGCWPRLEDGRSDFGCSGDGKSDVLRRESDYSLES